MTRGVLVKENSNGHKNILHWFDLNKFKKPTTSYSVFEIHDSQILASFPNESFPYF